jgi:hypothetical protein
VSEEDDESKDTETLEPIHQPALNVDGTTNQNKDCDETNDSNHQDDDDDDDEFDIDLAEELARMEAAGDDDDDDDDDDDYGPHRSSGGKKPLTTANEIDAYRVNLQTLQEYRPVLLAGEEFHLSLINDKDVEDILPKLKVAGTVQHHLVDDRTVVVLSQTGGTILQEGSLLVLSSKDWKMMMTSNDNKAPKDEEDEFGNRLPNIVVLGKILEVFGPVSQPLYSIRLPENGTESIGTGKPANHTPSDTNGNDIHKTNETCRDEMCILDTTTPDMHIDMTPTIKTADDPSILDSSTSLDTQTTSKPEPMSTNDQEDDTQQSQKASEFVTITQQSSTPLNAIDEIDIQSSKKESHLTDPWSASGILTRLVQQNPKLPVYFLPEGASILDLAALYRNNLKGCDASNVYDEEVTNEKEMDFSDDEQERIAKGRHSRKSGTKKVRGRTHPSPRNQSNLYHVRHHGQQQVMQQPPPQQRTPHGFYQPAVAAMPGAWHGGNYAPAAAMPMQPPTYASYPSASFGMPYYGPGQSTPLQYHYAAQPYNYHGIYSGVGMQQQQQVLQPPPPLPPSSQSQAEETSDTVYYDFS